MSAIAGGCRVYGDRFAMKDRQHAKEPRAGQDRGKGAVYQGAFEAVIALLMLFYLVLGSIFDTIAAMVLTLPFVYPLVTGLGYDPVWWGVINIVVIELGMITPPIGINLYVVQGIRARGAMGDVMVGALPFVVAMFVMIVLLLAFPGLALWAPSLVY